MISYRTSTSTQVVETSAIVTNSPSQAYTHPDEHKQSTYGMTPGFKPFTMKSKSITHNLGGYLIARVISICNRMRPSRIKENFLAYFQSFHTIALVAQRRRHFVKTLKIQVKFILNSTRTQCDYLFITERAKFSEHSMHVETQSVGPQDNYKSIRS